MIRYRKGNRVRDLVGLVFLLMGLTLLWVESSTVMAASAEIVATDVEGPVIGPADGPLETLDLRT